LSIYLALRFRDEERLHTTYEAAGILRRAAGSEASSLLI
jgi:hypothetical protein